MMATDENNVPPQTSGMDVSRQSGSAISFRDVQDSLSTFSGDDTYPISKWIDDMEEMTEVMNWSDLEVFVYSKKLLTGTDQLFVRSEKVICSWSALRN